VKEIVVNSVNKQDTLPNLSNSENFWNKKRRRAVSAHPQSRLSSLQPHYMKDTYGRMIKYLSKNQLEGKKYSPYISSSGHK
jgi:hypothetical protein